MTEACSADHHAPTGAEALFWPFLITRGHRVGYRVIAAPDFLVAARLSGLLFDLAGGSPTGPDRARYRLAVDTPVGHLLVMFTVRLADSSALGQTAPGTPLLDEHSRQIPLIEGVVERGERFASDTGDGPLRAGRTVCGPLFSGFWEAGDAWTGTTATAAFRMDRRAGRAIGWERLEPFRPGGSARPTTVRSGDSARPAPVRPVGGRSTNSVPPGGVSAAPANDVGSAGKGEPTMSSRGPLGGLGELLRRLLAWAVGSRRS
ncbi:hypothetical protein ACWEKM_00320 [Streptomyces sp. NPDC004752]